jgi:hypothetical protein
MHSFSCFERHTADGSRDFQPFCNVVHILFDTLRRRNHGRIGNLVVEVRADLDAFAVPRDLALFLRTIIEAE